MVVYIHGKETINKNALFLTQEERSSFWEKKRLGKGEETLNFNAYIKMHTPTDLIPTQAKGLNRGPLIGTHSWGKTSVGLVYRLHLDINLSININMKIPDQLGMVVHHIVIEIILLWYVKIGHFDSY